MANLTSPSKAFSLPGYNLVKILGTGAGSTIWEVRCQETHKVYAVKRVCKNDKNDERFFNQLLGEFEIGSKVNHTNIRKVYSIHKVRKMLRIVEMQMFMEYVEGQSVEQERPTTVLETCSVFAQVGNAMQALNQAGYVHADMKPNNIIVTPTGNVKIIDLGQCCPIGTVKTRIQGTPDFIAPEQVKKFPLDARTDVYNFGASIYWTLTGRPIPTVLARPGEFKVALTNITPPDKINQDVPPLLSKLILDCVRLQPAHRPATMKEVVNRLGLILQRMLATT